MPKILNRVGTSINKYYETPNYYFKHFIRPQYVKGILPETGPCRNE